MHAVFFPATTPATPQMPCHRHLMVIQVVRDGGFLPLPYHASTGLAYDLDVAPVYRANFGALAKYTGNGTALMYLSVLSWLRDFKILESVLLASYAALDGLLGVTVDAFCVWVDHVRVLCHAFRCDAEALFFSSVRHIHALLSLSRSVRHQGETHYRAKLS